MEIWPTYAPGSMCVIVTVGAKTHAERDMENYKRNNKDQQQLYDLSCFPEIYK